MNTSKKCEIIDDFAAKLRSLRGNLRLKEFAARIGVSLNTYQHYESKARKPNVQFVMQVARCCNVSTDWLLGLADSPIANAPASSVLPQIGLKQKMQTFKANAEKAVQQATSFLQTVEELERSL